jgi:hypothetical protein
MERGIRHAKVLAMIKALQEFIDIPCGKRKGEARLLYSPVL